MSVQRMAWADRQLKCACCGKVFDAGTASGEWGWGYGDKPCCGYACQRRLERADPKSRLNREAREARGPVPEPEPRGPGRPPKKPPDPKPRGRRGGRKSRQLSEAEQAAIAAAYVCGASMAGLCKRFGHSFYTVREALARRAVLDERRSGTALPKELRERALTLRGRGLTMLEIAAELGVGQSTVQAWLSREKKKGG